MQYDSLNIETNRREFKEKITDNLEREVVAFLNSNGGKIYIGIRDDGTVVGVDNADELQLQIKNRLINNIRPGIMGLFDIFLEQFEDKIVVVINLAGGTANPYYIRQYGRSEKGCYIRIGSASQPMTEEHIETLMQHSQRVSLLNITSRHQDLTFSQLKIFYEEKGKLLNAHFAKTLDFLTPEGKYNQLAFLFADNNNISIRLAKWWGTDKIDLRENEEYGGCSLIKAMQKVLDKFDIENVTFARKVGIGPREEKKLVDSKALREAIVNAFAHNKYTEGDTPVFEIFADRFEFTSYGGLIEGLTQEEFFSGVSRPRNPEIMRIFKDLEYVERLGSGIPYIVSKYGEGIFKLMSSVIRYAYLFDEVRELNGTTPAISQNDAKKSTKNHSKLSRNYPETTPKLPQNYPETIPILSQNYPNTISILSQYYSDTTVKLISAIQDNPKITIEKLSEIVGLTKIGVRWNIKNLKKRGIIRRVGSNRSGYWEIIQKINK
jgi:predicted HTH transcriptional regulator